MRAAVAVLVSALLVSAGCGGDGEAVTTGTTGTGGTGTTGTGGTGTTGTGGSTQPAGCTEQAGEIVALLPIAQRGCNEANSSVESGDRLFGGDELTTTASPSTLTFELELASSGTAHCGMSPDGAALIRPDADTDLEVRAGTVSCDAPAAARFTAPGAQVDVTGTLLSLTAEGDATTIKLYDGTVDVRSTADGSVQQLSSPSGQGCPRSAAQAVVTTSEPMQQTAYSVDPGELAVTGIVKLRIGLVPPSALEGLAAGMSESKTTVVTATEEQRNVLLDRDLVQQIPLVTAAAQPAEQPIQPGETVVGVGTFAALFDTFCRIRGDVPDARLLYTPFAFAAGPTTDTGTTSTESGTTSTETETATETGTDTGADTGTTPP